MSEVVRFGWRRYVDFFVERMIISKKTNKEYKADFWSMMTFDIVHLLTMMIFYGAVAQLTSSFLGWNRVDFFLFFCINLLMWKNLWLHNLRNFSSRLLRGALNYALMRPLNPYFSMSTRYINWQNFISSIGLLAIVAYVVLINDYSDYFFAFLIFIFGSLYFMAFYNFMSSFEFFFKKFELFEILMKVNSSVRQFTPKAFDTLSFKYVFYMVPTGVCTFSVIYILNGHLDEVLVYIPYALGLFLFFILGIVVNWHYGIKNYEGYN